MVLPIGLRPGWLIAGVAAALLPALWMWGFTVDDALVSVRYARHLAAGVGWRFDAGGPSTDGVTPLPWPLVLAVFAALGAKTALGVLVAAKALGLLAWAAAGAWLGLRVGAREAAPAWARGGALAVLATSVPVAAHAVSGMETGAAMALATCAALSVERPLRAAVLAGLAASLRPELGVWACVLAVGAAAAGKQGPRRALVAVLVAMVPFAACAVVRLVVWGRPGPLALMAKPSDVTHGALYAAAGVVVAVTPVLAAAPFAARRAPTAAVLLCAGIAHVLAVCLVGGDWMPYARLLAPVAPSLAWAGVLLAEVAPRGVTAVRTGVGFVLGVALFTGDRSGGRRVGADRAALVAEAVPALAGFHRVASLDVGWPSAATEADLVDLAGITDPDVAALPGGHTSKRIDGVFLLERDPDALLLYLPAGLPDGSLEAWSAATYARVVEFRLARDPLVQKHFAPRAWLPLGAKGAGYVLLERRDAPADTADAPD